MKSYYGRILAAICISVLLAGNCAASDPIKIQYSPRYHIAYIANGWDDLPAKIVDKWAAKIERRHGPATAADFRFQVDRLRNIGEWIDAAWEQRAAAWSRCYNTSLVSPGSITITLADDFFTLSDWPGRTLAGAVMNYKLGTIQVVACAWNGSTWRTAPELIEWELDICVPAPGNV